MSLKAKRMGILFLLTILSPALHAAPAPGAWQPTVSSDLTDPANWNPAVFPVSVATFDSTYTPTTYLFNPFVDNNAQVTFDSFVFNHSASAFTFNFGDPTGAGALVFNGAGITSTAVPPNTNTTILATNYFGVPYPQVAFYQATSAASTSLGSASIKATNAEQISNINPTGNLAQVILGDDSVTGFTNTPMTVTDNASIFVLNLGFVGNNDYNFTNEAAQIFLGGNSFGTNTPAANNVTFQANNNQGRIQAGGNAGQLLINAGNNSNMTFTLGDDAKFTFNNLNDGDIGSDNNNCGQMVVDGSYNKVTLTFGNNADFSFTNAQYSQIINPETSPFPNVTGNDAGQFILDGDNGTVIFAAGDNANFCLINGNGQNCFNFGSSNQIFAGGFDAGQLIVDGDSGTASFSAGTNANINIVNNSCAFISTGTDANDAAQLLVDANLGSATFSVGDNSTINVYNDGNISASSNQPGILVGQIVFDGHNAGVGGVASLTTGTDVAIIATLGPDGLIRNLGGNTFPAQMYFSDATVTGAPTLIAINQNFDCSNNIKGIVFDGTSTAGQSNIILQNSSLVVSTTAPLQIGSLTGDNSSGVELSQSLVINTPVGESTEFDGVIKDVLGSNNVTIAGPGTQVLNGANTYGGVTTVNGGLLILNGSVLKDVIVNAGALSGTGTVGRNLTVNNGGVVSPGNPLGVLTVDGAFAQNAGSALLVNIQGQGNAPGINNGELAVAGATTIDPTATVAVLSLDGSFFIGGKYTIVNSAGGLNNTVYSPTVISLNTSLQPVLSYDANNVYLSYQEAFLGCACNNNAFGVAEQLISISDPSVDPDLEDLLLAITSLDCPGICAALDDLSGAPYADLLLGVELSTHQFVRRLYDPLRTFLAKDRNCCEDECSCRHGLDFWVEAGGMQSQFDSHKRKHHGNSEAGHGHRLGYKGEGYQVTAGAQMEGDNTWVAGAALTYEHTNDKFHHGANGHTDTVLGGLYGAYRVCDLYMVGDLVFGGSGARIKRHFFVGEEEFHQHGRPEAFQGILYGEFGGDFRYCSFLIQPFLGLEGGYYSYSHIKEHGDEVTALEFKKRSYGTFDTRLGVHLATDQLACGLYVGVDLAWQYRCTGLNNRLDAEFIEWGNGFRVHGSDLDPNSFEAALNLEQKLGDNWSIYATGFWQQWSTSSYAYDILGGIAFHW